MESLSDFLSRNPPPRGNGPLDQRTDFMNLRKLQPHDQAGHTVERDQARHTVEYERAIDGLVRGLMELLPKPGGIWRLEDRVKWLRLATDIFDLGYKASQDEPGEISIVAIKQVTPSGDKSRRERPADQG